MTNSIRGRLTEEDEARREAIDESPTMTSVYWTEFRPEYGEPDATPKDAQGQVT